MTGLPDRIAARIDVADCWYWTGEIISTGYGRTGWQGRQALAHRLVRHLLVGDVEPWTTDRKTDVLDHLCRVRNCVNPDHVEPVTARENTLRGQTVAAGHAAQTHCVNGHRFDEANTAWRSENPEARRCRACSRIRKRRRPPPTDDPDLRSEVS